MRLTRWPSNRICHHILVGFHPRYLGSADPCPQATLTLLRELGEILGLDLPVGAIENKAKQWRSRCDVTVRNNADLEHFVSQLERDYDLHQHAKELSAGRRWPNSWYRRPRHSCGIRIENRFLSCTIGLLSWI